MFFESQKVYDAAEMFVEQVPEGIFEIDLSEP